jgi:hypothetical protein
MYNKMTLVINRCLLLLLRLHRRRDQNSPTGELAISKTSAKSANCPYQVQSRNYSNDCDRMKMRSLLLLLLLLLLLQVPTTAVAIATSPFPPAIINRRLSMKLATVVVMVR